MEKEDIQLLGSIGVVLLVILIAGLYFRGNPNKKLSDHQRAYLESCQGQEYLERKNDTGELTLHCKLWTSD